MLNLSLDFFNLKERGVLCKKCNLTWERKILWVKISQSFSCFFMCFLSDTSILVKVL